MKKPHGTLHAVQDAMFKQEVKMGITSVPNATLWSHIRTNGNDIQ